MGKVFDFGDISISKASIKNTWYEFRDKLKNGEFTYIDTEKAMETTFLKVFNDLFNTNHGINQIIKKVEDISFPMGRGSKLSETESINYDRFVPNAQFIKSPNRFSPPNVEWLYLALEDSVKATDIAKNEIKVSRGDRFGFCYFNFSDNTTNKKIVDLTIAENYNYEDFNDALENYAQEVLKKEKLKALILRKLPKREKIVDKKYFDKIFLE